MDEVLKYLETIAAIDAIERKRTPRKAGSKGDWSAAHVAELNQANDAAQAAWAAIAPEFQQRLYPPPVRLNSDIRPSPATGCSQPHK
jgi:hypothetical protein